MHGHGEVGVTTERRDAVHECMRRERGRNAQARESVERWPEVREGLTYDICMSMKRKQPTGCTKLTSSDTSEHMREGAGQMRRHTAHTREPSKCSDTSLARVRSEGEG
jgi:hypothetical protein